MDWLVALFAQESIVRAIIILSVVASIGLLVGSIRFGKVSIGVAAVLFTGLAAGHFGVKINPEVLAFARDAGLVLFVYCVGIQVGPGFVASLQRDGLRLNALAMLVILMGVGIALLSIHSGHISVPIMSGVYAGAVTNTPALAAAQQALGPGLGAESPALGYAAAYPGGVMGLILVILLVRQAGRIRKSQTETEEADELPPPPLRALNIEVTQVTYEGIQIGKLTEIVGCSVTISRHLSGGRMSIAAPDVEVRCGDLLLAVGAGSEVERFCQLVGHPAKEDLRSMPSNVAVRPIVVTKRNALNRPLKDALNGENTSVIATRLFRGDVELTPSPELPLKFGDRLQLVGEQADIDRAAAKLGNSKDLEMVQVAPILLGIALGVLLGSWPIPIPGLREPVRLGLAGGPLIVAMFFSRLGYLGPLSWYLPIGANHSLRDLGIAVFLACVGLKAGEHFVSTLVHGEGLTWMGWGFMITVIPLVIVAALSRLVFRMKFTSTAGLLAGSLTDPPALAFTASLGNPQVAYLSYATVYPLTLITRVISVQLMILLTTQS